MPEAPFAPIKPHPFKQPTVVRPARARAVQRYAELAVTTNYTFLAGASHPEEMIERAAELGHCGVSITDSNTLAGIVRAHVAAKEAGIPLAVGSRLTFSDAPGMSFLVYPTDRPAYSRLCQLLTLGKRRAPKGECHLTVDDLVGHSPGLLAVAMVAARPSPACARTLHRLRGVFDQDRLSLGVARLYVADSVAAGRNIRRLASDTRIPLAAVNDVHYHVPARRPLQDVLTCIRHGCTIEQAGMRLHANADRHLKAPDEMLRLFADDLGAASRSVDVVLRAAAFSLDELKYEYPAETCPADSTPIQYLVDRTWAGAVGRYPDGVPEKVKRALEHEFKIIEALRYEPYFLTCYDIVSFARSQGILCQGRGAAANSSVCYCLGITEVNPARSSMLFERFVSAARNEPPDIDIDFEHERREEVIQYLYRKYGRERAALTAEVVTYRGRSAVREVGKALGLSLDCVDVLAKNLDAWHESPNAKRIRETGLDPSSPVLRDVLRLTGELMGFPRHLSQHVGGFVITRSPLSDLVPIENAAMEDRTVIEWNKDDIDAMGMLKIDVLGLGMLTCIRKAFELDAPAQGQRLTIPTLMGPLAEDPAVYSMIQRADTVGVFQIESRAQMSMLPRLKPENFYDLVIEVAIVRPGPIQGKMVHPYLRRRSGEEVPHYPNDAIREVLGRTLGVPLFQEQAMQLAIVAAGFTADEADKLRRAMAAWKRKGDLIYRFGKQLIAGMTERGYSQDFAGRCFEQIKGFSEYGFPESHAASFAILVYVSCWLKRHRPAAFAAALINSQPMGFYQPAQIIRDAREHGVEVRPIDVNHSGWDCALETRPPLPPQHADPLSPSDWGTNGPALRLGMRLTRGLSELDARRISDAVGKAGRFKSIGSLWRASGAPVAAMRRLAQADAMQSMGLDRQAALWQVRPLRDEPMPLFEACATDDNVPESLPTISPEHLVLHDYNATGLSLKAHPMSFMRASLDKRSVTPNIDLRSERLCPQGRIVEVAGLVLVRQRPGTASGVVFITLEDETGICNLILWSTVFEAFRKAARLSTTLLAKGRVERSGEVVHVHVQSLTSLDDEASQLASVSRDFH